MSANCCNDVPDGRPRDRRYRRVLWSVLVINAAMFLVEIIAGLAAGSASLQADALDFLADAANYGISLFVVGMGLPYRASAALAKGMTMGLFGVWVLAMSIWHVIHGILARRRSCGSGWPEFRESWRRSAQEVG